MFVMNIPDFGVPEVDSLAHKLQRINETLEVPSADGIELQSE